MNKFIDLCSKNDNKHVAGIYKNGKLLCNASNDTSRTIYNKNITCSLHAEINVLIKYKDTYSQLFKESNPHKIRRKMRKISLYVARDSMNNSLPCDNCYNELIKLSINKVIFSYDGTFHIQKLNQEKIFVTRKSKCTIKNIDNIRIVSIYRTR